jgi:hypothetical protein
VYFAVASPQSSFQRFSVSAFQLLFLMRFLRNPFVSGVLAAAAAVLVYYRLVGPRSQFGGAAGPVAVLQSLIPGRAPVTPSNRSEIFSDILTPGPDRGIDRNYIESRFAKWVAIPQRDPFLLIGGDPLARSKEELEFLSPIANWKLNAIWDQTGSRLAVINNAVHQVGDEVEGYKIIRIESEEVWFQGPKRKERLGRTQKGPVVLPNPVFMPANAQTNNENLKR